MWSIYVADMPRFHIEGWIRMVFVPAVSRTRNPSLEKSSSLVHARVRNSGDCRGDASSVHQPLEFRPTKEPSSRHAQHHISWDHHVVDAGVAILSIFAAQLSSQWTVTLSSLLDASLSLHMVTSTLFICDPATVARLVVA